MIGRLGAASFAVAVLVAAVSALPADARTSVRHFSTPIHVDNDPADQTGEPSITVAPDGTEYIVAPDGPGVRAPSGFGGAGVGGSLIWRSDDAGRSWSFLGSYDVPTGGGDSALAVAPNGTLYASGLSYAACSTVGVSTDKGQTWLADPLAGCASMPVMNDRQWIATDGSSTVYTAIGDTLGGSIDLVRADLTHGLAVASTTLQLYTAGDYQWPGTIALDQRRGTAYVAWNTTGAPNDCDGTPGSGSCAPQDASTVTPDAIYVSAVPRGAMSAPVPSLVAKRAYDTFDSFVSDAVDAAGNVYVVWSERHPLVRQTWIMLSVSRNGGRSWTAPVRVGRSVATAVYPWVTAGDAGRIAVSFYGTSASGTSPQTVPSSATWSVWSSFSTNYGATFTYYRTTGTMQNGPICTSGTSCPLSARNLLDFFSTASDPSGCLVTSYADNSAGGNAAFVSYVRQTSGPGLRAGRLCRPASA
jgi:hypothetical protein